VNARSDRASRRGQSALCEGFSLLLDHDQAVAPSVGTPADTVPTLARKLRNIEPAIYEL
jgi:hypothetical protein